MSLLNKRVDINITKTEKEDTHKKQREAYINSILKVTLNFHCSKVCSKIKSVSNFSIL